MAAWDLSSAWRRPDANETDRGGKARGEGDTRAKGRARLSVVPPPAPDDEPPASVASPETIPAAGATSQSHRFRSTTTVERAVKRPMDETVARAQAGDTQAFTALFEQHKGIVTRIAFRMLGPSADLDDIVQEVFLQVYRSLPSFRGQSKFTTWLHRVSVNVVLMSRRRAKSRPSYVQEEAGRHEPDRGAPPDREVARGRRVEAFQRLLEKISEKKRTVFILHEIEGMSPADIAATVECPVLTVRTRLFYARRELAQLMRTEPSLEALLEGSSAPPVDESDTTHAKESDDT